MAVPVPKMGPSRATVSSVIQLALGRVRADASWSAHLEKKLQSAIQKWVSIVLEDPLSFDVGRRCAAAACQDAALSQGLLHTFQGNRRAPFTIVPALCSGFCLGPRGVRCGRFL